MKLSKEDMEFAQDVIWSALEYAESEGYPEESAWSEARSTLEDGGLSTEEIAEAFDKYNE